MADLDDQLNSMCADGRISAEDADEVRNFADFLTAVAGIPTKAEDATPEQSRAWCEAYREHYPEDYMRAMERMRKEADRG